MQAELNIKAWLDHPDYEMQKGIVNREANRHKLNIDYSVFKKSKEEKAQLATMKLKLPKTKHYKFKSVLHEQF